MFLLVQCVVLAITAGQNSSSNSTSTSGSGTNTSNSTSTSGSGTNISNSTSTSGSGTTLTPNVSNTTLAPNVSNTTLTPNVSNTTLTPEPTPEPGPEPYLPPTPEPTPEPTTETLSSTLTPNVTNTTIGNTTIVTNTTQEGTETTTSVQFVDVVYNFNFDKASCDVAGLQDTLRELTTDAIEEVTGLAAPDSDVARCGSIHVVKSYKVDEARLDAVKGTSVQDAIATSLTAAIAADPALAGLDLSFVLAVVVADDSVACPLPLPLHAKTTYLLAITGGEDVCLVIDCDAGYSHVGNVCKFEEETTLTFDVTDTTQETLTFNVTNPTPATLTFNVTNTTQAGTETTAPVQIVDVVYNFNFAAASCDVAGLQGTLRELTSDAIEDTTGLDTPDSDVVQCGSIHVVKSYKVDEARLDAVKGTAVEDAIATSLKAAIAADPALAGLDLSFVLSVVVADDSNACPAPLPLHAKTTYLLAITGGEDVCVVIDCDANYSQLDGVCKLNNRGIGVNPRSGLSGGEIAGIVLASLVAAALVALVITFVTRSEKVVKATNEPVEA